MVEDGIMLEDLKELRRIMDRFIAKYEQAEEYLYGDELQDDERLKDLGKELLKDKDNNLNNDGFWRGNDVY